MAEVGGGLGLTIKKDALGDHEHEPLPLQSALSRDPGSQPGSDVLKMLEVEPVGIHDFGPGCHKVVEELLFGIGKGVNLCNGTEFCV